MQLTDNDRHAHEYEKYESYRRGNHHPAFCGIYGIVAHEFDVLGTQSTCVVEDCFVSDKLVANGTSMLICKRSDVDEDLPATTNRGDKTKTSIVFPFC